MAITTESNSLSWPFENKKEKKKKQIYVNTHLHNNIALLPQQHTCCPCLHFVSLPDVLFQFFCKDNEIYFTFAVQQSCLFFLRKQAQGLLLLCVIMKKMKNMEGKRKSV